MLQRGKWRQWKPSKTLVISAAPVTKSAMVSCVIPFTEVMLSRTPRQLRRSGREFRTNKRLLPSKDGIIVGLLIGHTEDEYAANFSFSDFNQPMALRDKEAAHIESALHWMDRLFPVPRSGSYCILEFAVSRQAQGAGIAGQLLKAAKAQAIVQGCGQICLGVAADNEAVGFYRHLGFYTEVETRVPLLNDEHGIGLHLYMVCDIAKLV